ncbi:MAG: threonylcarbamoyl-AMP synthase [Bacteroidetes bacterium]|jgi:tRNA threonylcarbamoyl adenosine modification protein (Sua5/YciO/YrdC/YwlC family)|nr:threonylcarbamoyl-AMP synthase [Bacteroidota bacterium]MBU1577938.1 threonylcarbamoyl-AMP synthase [Bacteroidota bacterium]MBU2466465.1 threonylcarbamoyl-AMP synthase [Bacteroidota bacterium]MBU2556577.1 threonylcarbamoyl-AMP synthase [Bacteroidota bacterium]MDA3943513.1 L-threonylcarbamoyladenylate synthase [Bacteroidota bacterium]
MLLKIYPENPSPRHIKTVIECLNDGGLVIFPTDTVYGLGSSIHCSKALDKVAQLKGIKKEKANFSFIFNNLSMLSEFTTPIGNEVFKLMRRNLPGPFTFILNANQNVPKIFQNKKKTIGIRIPDENIIHTIVEELGHPIATTSILDDDKILEYTTDPELIYEKYKDRVDIVIDGGFGGNQPSTIIDCTGNEMVILREAKGKLE